MKILLAFLILICINGMLFASGHTFSFLEKAKEQYRFEKSNATSGNEDYKGIDSLLNLASTSSDFSSAYTTSWKIGLFLLKQGKHPFALDIFNEMSMYLEAKSPKTNDDQISLSSVYNIIGAIYEETGLWNEALDRYMHSLQICNTIKYEPGKAKVYNNLGNLYFNRNEINKAEELFNKAIEINKKYAIHPELLNNYINLAGIYKLRKNSKKAIEYALVALNQIDLNNDSYDLSWLYFNIGNLYEDMRNYNVALSYYQLSADIGIRKQYTVILINAYLSIASVYKSINKPIPAEEYIVKSLEQADKLGNPLLQTTVLKNAATFYRQKGNFNLASGYYSKYVNLNDSLEALNSLTKIEQIQSVYEVINKEKDNQILKQKVNLQQLAIQRQRVILFAGLLLFIFLAYFLINLQRNRKRERTNNEFMNKQSELLHQKEKEMLITKENNLELELEFKKKELTLNVMSFMKLNEMLSDISEKIILTGKTAEHQETRDALKKIGKEVQKSTELETLKEFSLRFKEVNKDFFDLLLAKFPNLTPSELRLCALLNLNMSTKEISELTGQRQKAIEIARYRLRHKLGIANSDINLVTFLAQI